ncbi:prenyltransferase [Embleya sp. MST-111070]|uniref:prenyltransferase n=1 Tax=Embleya sp. MST-111070 TaxID=3398231 RepID=UPI003F7343D0
MNRTEWIGFVRLARLRFLLYNMLPVALGGAVAVHEGHRIDLGWYALAQGFAWVTHLMTHYCNEYFDLDADRANRYHTPWTGGSRALVDGLVRPIVSLSTAFVLLAGAVFVAVAMPTLPTRLTAAAGITLAWFYTAPPLRLNYRGLGELTVAVGLNGIWPIVAVSLLAGGVPGLILLILAPTALLQAARMMVMNLADIESDARVGKRTLPVLLGPRRVIVIFTLCQITAYAALVVFALAGWVPWPVCAAMAGTAPLSVWLVGRLRSGALADHDPRRMTPVVFWASNHVALIVCAALVGVLAETATDPQVNDGMAGSLSFLTAILAGFLVLFGVRLVMALRRLHSADETAPIPCPAEKAST